MNPWEYSMLCVKCQSIQQALAEISEMEPRYESFLLAHWPQVGHGPRVHFMSTPRRTSLKAFSTSRRRVSSVHPIM